MNLPVEHHNDVAVIRKPYLNSEKVNLTCENSYTCAILDISGVYISN